MNVTSYHFDRQVTERKQLNERNFGLGLENDKYLLGFYNNSYHKTTMYALAKYTPIHYSITKTGIIGGFASGYRSPIVVGFLLDVSNEDAGVNLVIAPPVTYKGKHAYGFAGLQLKWRII